MLLRFAPFEQGSFASNSLAKEGLSGTYQKKYHQVLHSMFTCAVRWQLLSVNPVLAVEPPKQDMKDYTPYTDKQSLELLEALESEPLLWQAVVILALYMQLRRGEIIGLNWDRIDFNRRTISIEQSAVYISGEKPIIKEPKTKAGRRSLSMPSDVVKILKAWRAEQNEQRLKLGEQWQDTGAVFTQWNGERLHVCSPTKWFNHFLKRHDLPIIRFHDLRHTGASLLISAGLDIETVKKRLGHTRASTTMDIYGHAYQKNDEKALNVLQELLSKRA